MVAEVIGVGAAMTDPAALQRTASLLSGELGSSDITLGNSVAVGTNVQRLRGAIAKALGRADIVFIIGGMGATADDITKKTVCEGLDRKLVLHKESLERVRQAYERAGRQMPRAVNSLAMMPEQSVVFPGRRGLTPGCALSAGKQYIIMLPEAEKEFLPIVQFGVTPYLSKFSSAAMNTRVVNVFGSTAAEVQATLNRKYTALRNPTVSVREKNGEVQVVVTTRAKSKAEASALSAPIIKELLALLGTSVYGVDQDSLQSVVIGALRANRMTMSAAEYGTKGQMTKLLEQVETSSQAFPYGVSAESARIRQDALKVPDKLLRKYGEVSEQFAAALAKGAMDEGGTDVGIGIAGSGGERNEDGKKAGIFFVAVCDKRSLWVKRIELPKTAGAEYMRYMACLTALDLARLMIAALPKLLEGANPLQLAMSGKIANVLSQKPVPLKGKTTDKPKKKKGFFAKVFPVKGDSGGDVALKLILLVAISTFLCSAGYLGYFQYQSMNNKMISEEIAGMYVEGMDETTVTEVPGNYPKDYQKKFANLFGINEDVAGWLKIPDTQVNYPVVHYIDNDYYNRRDFYKKPNKHGVPWLEARDSMEPQSDNYVIYGHNMTDGQMFGELLKYKPSGEGIEFLKAHPVISMDDVYRNNDYKIISVFITNTKAKYGDIFYYNYFLDLQDKAVFDEFVGEVTSRSFYTSDVDIKYGDKFLTLSTCSYEYGPVSDDADVRTVVVGRRVRPGEKADGSGINYALNPAPKMPVGFVNHQNGQTAQAAQAPATAQTTMQASDGMSLSTSTQQQTSGASQAVSSSGMTAKEREESEYQEWLASSKAASREAARLASEEEEARLQASEREESRRASEAESSRRASEAALEEAAESSRRASEAAAAEASRKASEEAAAAESSRKASEAAAAEASKKASEEAAAAESSKKASEAAAAESSRKAAEEAAAEANKNNGSSGEGGDDVTQMSAHSNEKLTVYAGGKKVTGTADTIVPQVVMNEMGAGFSKEALKAQAVAVYTYIKHQNKSGTIPSLGMKTPNATVKNACNAVLGEAVYYKGNLAFTPFFATSAGATTSSAEVWGGSYSYLTSVDSEIDRQAKNFETTVTISADSVASKVDKAMDIDLYDYSDDPDDWFSIEDNDSSGIYVKKLRVGDDDTSGRYFRESVLGLRSAAFEISYSSRTDSFTFTTYGYGHGVGMSQTGANLYASQEGWGYEEILEHYYPGARVQ